MSDADALFEHLGAIEALLERIVERLPEKPELGPCGEGFGPWVNDQRPTCQKLPHHEGECGPVRSSLRPSWIFP